MTVIDTKLNESLLTQLKQVALDAGVAIMNCYNRDVKQWQKADESPLTEADLAAHEVIVQQLQAMTPTTPILSEESADIPWSERQSWSEYWLVDPLDGTKEFIKRNGEFTVNIALIRQHRPVMSVVYAPVLEKLYFAAQGSGAWLQVADEAPQPLSLERHLATEPVRLVGSRSHPSPDMLAFAQQFSATEVVPMGSSLKFCILAEGLAECYPRLGPTMEWDTAAGHCIAEQAGARVTELDGSQLFYNSKESLLNPYFVVARADLHWQAAAK